MPSKRSSGGEESVEKKKKTEHLSADQERGGNESESFKKSASLVIQEMVDLDENCQSELMDELLHSIFFLGEIQEPKCPPGKIVTDDKKFKDLKKHYPRPFDLCSSQLPKRSPMSCVLDLFVNREGQENEVRIKERLRELMDKLKRGKATDLVSSTVCVSQADSKKSDSVRYYGVSMSTSGNIVGKIMVGASCLSTWHSYVAGAVMTYYPEKTKKPYFDGTIKLPERVRCEAFNITNGEKIDPCKSCENLFGLKTSQTQQWAYGHCAEAESLSNLFKGEEGVRKDVKTNTGEYTDTGRKRAENEVKTKLAKFLEGKKFNWDNNFYNPSVGNGVNN